MEFLTIDGVRLAFARIPAPSAAAAPSQKAPLVFLHEGLGSVELWRDWPARLCQASGRAGLVYSRRGYGQSDAVPDVRGPSRTENGLRCGRLRPDYLHVEAWQVLPALLRALEIEGPVLVGHSDGASIALLHAVRHPVAACVVMAPHVLVEEISLQSIAQARTAFETGGLRQKLTRYHQDVDCAFWQWSDVWLSEGFRSFDIRAECAQIAAPLLALQGDDDAYGSMAHLHALQAKAPGLHAAPVQLQALPHCGHSPHIDQAALSLQLVTEFLRGVA
ncbi:MAG: alpha/beta fold hydrolase [Burkholderiaceae bacterium]